MRTRCPECGAARPEEGHRPGCVRLCPRCLSGDLVEWSWSMHDWRGRYRCGHVVHLDLAQLFEHAEENRRRRAEAERAAQVREAARIIREHLDATRLLVLLGLLSPGEALEPTFGADRTRWSQRLPVAWPWRLGRGEPLRSGAGWVENTTGRPEPVFAAGHPLLRGSLSDPAG
ncbi:hypothetical protein [Streptosporangium sp. NPDC002524]|uniref:hypothetical protein n=1 Tax=Streptosporangium sp. NPDC002524 TaxID=3154537 RepID=UPI003327CBC9